MCLLIYDIDTCNDMSQPTFTYSMTSFPAKMYLFKVNNRNTRKRGEICPKLTTKTPERRQ